MSNFNGLLRNKNRFPLQSNYLQYTFNSNEMIRKVLTTVIIISIFSGVLSAQEKWSLERCIQYANENNLQIKLQELNTRINENLLLQSRLNILPSLNAGSGQSLTFGRSIDFFTNLPVDDNNQSFNYQVNSQFTLFNGFQTINNIRQSNLNLKASEKDLEKMRNDIALSIASAYLQILFAAEQLAIAQDQVEISKLQVNRTSALVDAGSLPQGSLLEIQSQLAIEELRLVNAKNIFSISYLTLTQFLDLPSSENFEIEVPDFSELAIEKLAYSVDEIYNTALGLQPQIQSAGYNLESAMKGLSIAKGRRSPRLGLSAAYGSGYRRLIRDGEVVTIPGIPTDFWEQLDNNQSRSLSMSLSIPIFNSFQTSTGIKNARVNVYNYDYQLQLRKNQLYKDIQQAYADAVSAFENYQASTKAVEATEESFRYTEQRFNVGLLTSVEYNTAKNQLTRVQSDLLRSRYEYIFKINVLEFYLGNPLSL